MDSEADGRGVLGFGMEGVLGFGMERIRKEEKSFWLIEFAFVLISREERESASRTLNQELNVDEWHLLDDKPNQKQTKPTNMNKPSLHFDICLEIAPSHLSLHETRWNRHSKEMIVFGVQGSVTPKELQRTCANKQTPEPNNEPQPNTHSPRATLPSHTFQRAPCSCSILSATHKCIISLKHAASALCSGAT
jgi:hypothetical protein